MGAREESGRAAGCQDCGRGGPDVRERGRVFPAGMRLCDACWKRVADELADQEGATDSARPEPDLDRLGREQCGKCRTEVVKYQTNYERWVSLGTKDLLGEAVRLEYSWRVLPVKAANTEIVVDHVAEKVYPSTWKPMELVRLAHRAVCSDWAA